MQTKNLTMFAGKINNETRPKTIGVWLQQRKQLRPTYSSNKCSILGMRDSAIVSETWDNVMVPQEEDRCGCGNTDVTCAYFHNCNGAWNAVQMWPRRTVGSTKFLIMIVWGKAVPNLALNFCENAFCYICLWHHWNVLCAVYWLHIVKFPNMILMLVSSQYFRRHDRSYELAQIKTHTL